MSAIPAERDPYIVYSDAPESVYDSIIINGRVQDMTGATASFFVRPLASRVPVINPSTPNAHVIVPTDSNGNNVRYDWAAGDMATLGKGDFMYWWQFVLPGLGAQDTYEVPLRVSDHGPGVGIQIGAIVTGVAAHMPVSLDALRNDQRYGDLWLQQQCEVVKLRTMGTTVSPDSEIGLGTVFLDYLSKRLALQLINPAIEYWSRQMRSSTATGPSEVTSFPDMIASLKELGRRLVRELTQEWRDLMAIQPGLAVRQVVPLPATTLGDPTDPTNGYVSADPRNNQPLLTGGVGWGLEFDLWAYGVWPFP